MDWMSTSDVIAWTLIAAGIAFAVTSLRMPRGAALAAAALAGMVAKTALLELV